MPARSHRLRRRLVAAALASALSIPAAAQSPVELRDRGLALLENEQPAEAEAVWRELARRVPDDPLPHADLAVALLRQQQLDAAQSAVATALAKAPDSADVLAIDAEIRRWRGDVAGALAAVRRAVEVAPRSPRLQFLRLDIADASRDEAARQAADAALAALARLRPENLYVLLRGGRRALERGDRAEASRVFVRVRELLWQALPIAATTLERLLDALEAAELEAARVQALRLENVLKVSPAYQRSLAELTPGVQGMPLTRFAAEPPRTAFGAPLDVRFAARRIDGRATGGGLVAVDLDGDERVDLARLRGEGDAACVEVRLAARELAETDCLPAAGASGLAALDLDNDGWLDLVALGRGGVVAFAGRGGGAFAPARAAGGGAAALAALDVDFDGDLDLALAGGAAGWELLRNALDGSFAPVGSQALRAAPAGAVRALRATDLDRDGALDLVAGGDVGVTWLRNRWQGELAAGPAVAVAGGISDLVSADLGQDGTPELLLTGDGGLTMLRLEGDTLTPWRLALPPAASRPQAAVVAFDADNDGRLDLALAGSAGVVALARRDAGFGELPVAGGPAWASVLAAADLDGDGDLDLVAGGADGLHVLRNDGGNRNGYLSVRLRGLETGSSKSNRDGIGATLELFAGRAYQFREVTSPVTHFGIGALDRVDLLRAVWTNGVPQNRLEVGGDQRIVEEQVLKGSCPFLYAWDGERVAFVSDLLWGAPIGLPLAPGVWADSNPEELVRVERAEPRDGRYELRVTEELWEAAFFDRVRLWVVDAPEGVELSSNLRILPGRHEPPAVLGARDPRPVARAVDGAGRDVTDRVARRDEVYADGYRPSRYQGQAAAPWSFEIDLGETPDEPVRLLLEGWVFPSDASLNLAMAQREDIAHVLPRIEVEAGGGWQPLAELGLPPGKTKRMLIDLPPLPPGAHRLRIVTTAWISWDRIAWSTAPDDAAPRVVARLPPTRAELAFRGFSELARAAPNAPHAYRYDRVSHDAPWLPFPGRYTRYGDVRELLAAADDRLVILAAGDELALEFDVSELPAPPAGWRREVFLESLGWDKDADRNTCESAHVEPLPFRAMSGYPFAPGESYPDTPELREYRKRWLTREIAAPPAGAPAGLP